MAFISLNEIIDLIIMIAAVGFIFKDSFVKRPIQDYDPLKFTKNYSWEDWKFAALITAPAIVLHELAHKFVALSFGIPAVFHASYTWLGIGMLLKLMNFGFLFFVPGYVTFPSALATSFERFLIAFSGPGTNLALFVFAWASIKYSFLPSKYNHALVLTKQINLFLFIFNMIPLPPFDGAAVFGSLLTLI